MRRLLALAFVALSGIGCGVDPEPIAPARPAPPQRAELGWVERYDKSGARFTFRVLSFEVLADGWRAEVSVTNGTRVRYSVGDPQATLARMFGVMLLETGDPAELERLNRRRELPPVRRAQRYRPSLPLVLEPGKTWSGVISAPGTLAAGRWVRVVFGAFVPVGEPPEGFPATLVWITDHAHRLRGDRSAGVP